MIVVTLGTHPQPMTRLVSALAEIARTVPGRGPFEAQLGVTPKPDGWVSHSVLSRSEVSRMLAGSDIVITHGGPATIAESRSLGRIPIVVPRQARYGEHVDDHQRDYARRLADAEEIILVEDVAHLLDAVRDYEGLVSSLPPPRVHDASPAVAHFARIADGLTSRR